MSGPPEGFPVLAGLNSGKTLEELEALPRRGEEERWREAVLHAGDCDQGIVPGETGNYVPCYFCGDLGNLFCSACCRSLCGVCLSRGEHWPDRVCSFIIPGRSPDAPKEEAA